MGMSTDTYTDRIRQLCTAFKLPTVGAEAVPRFQQAGYGEALETLLEVLELEAEDPDAIGADHPAAARLPSATG